MNRMDRGSRRATRLILPALVVLRVLGALRNPKDHAKCVETFGKSSLIFGDGRFGGRQLFVNRERRTKCFLCVVGARRSTPADPTSKLTAPRPFAPSTSTARRSGRRRFR